MTFSSLRILVITKRQYTGRDLLDDCYGRLFEIPKALAQQGHRVRGLALSYRHRNSICPSLKKSGGVRWETMNALPFSPIGATLHLKRIKKICLEFCPDIVWASSDAWHAIAAELICRPLAIPYVIDLYDNYESFGLSKFPCVSRLFRSACRQAQGLTPVSTTLARHIQAHYAIPTDLPMLCLGNAVDTAVFKPLNKATVREKLGLPQANILIGTAGALDSSRGIGTLLQAYAQLLTIFPTLRLVVAGPRDKTLGYFDSLPLYDLGVIPTERVPLFWNALDVAIISNKDSAFGKYCYPQKLQEIVACGVPLVASDVGEVREILQGFSEYLAEPDSPNDLAMLIARQIEGRTAIPLDIRKSWKERSEDLSQFFVEIHNNTKKTAGRSIC